MQLYRDKYSLTRSQNMFLAKKKWDENIYCGMRMENRNVTFPQTQTILNGVNVGSVSLDDIQAILNMRDAWKYLLGSIDAPLNIRYLCKLNEHISRNESLEWGVLRNGNAGISGVSYVPPIPNEAEVSDEFAAILVQGCTDTEKALDVFLWGARRQLFWDGNKRTSLLAANKLLVSSGKGMLTIKDECMAQFADLLSSFYESGEGMLIKGFLYEHTIAGISFA